MDPLQLLYIAGSTLIGGLTGLFLAKRKQQQQPNNPTFSPPKYEEQEENFSHNFPNFDAKMVFVARKDLKMTRSEVASLVSCCTLRTFDAAYMINRPLLFHWRQVAQAKIVTCCQSEEEIQTIFETATAMDVPVAMMNLKRSGKEQLDTPGVIGLFGTREQVDPITGHLKLYN
ncbi:putative peptidyl-tRNA hydrolase, PTH2 family [Blattamonas nauphoetae]|uniref:peptidyl-tRNA hydrolase n=1 Tax=Blattamonas nauphoetae TaxID=2049346 RepID=A0ABQ9Y9Q2_9EUKA|nr:putative peptidyl-tRNA hydrolase, PTH2 family [Blattamonas nauphoetae]